MQSLIFAFKYKITNVVLTLNVILNVVLFYRRTEFYGTNFKHPYLYVCKTSSFLYIIRHVIVQTNWNHEIYLHPRWHWTIPTLNGFLFNSISHIISRVLKPRMLEQFFDENRVGMKKASWHGEVFKTHLVLGTYINTYRHIILYSLLFIERRVRTILYVLGVKKNIYYKILYRRAIEWDFCKRSVGPFVLSTAAFNSILWTCDLNRILRTHTIPGVVYVSCFANCATFDPSCT